MKPLRVVGLDLSLTSTGMSDGTNHQVTQTTPDDPVEQRLDRVLTRVQFFVGRGLSSLARPDLVVIEGAAWSKARQMGHEELSALRLMVRHDLWLGQIPFAVVGPSTLKAYTTGHGQSTKQQMAAAVAERHGFETGGIKVKDGRYDVVDAFALAAMGYARLGQPLPTQGPPAPMKSLLAVDWPAAVTEYTNV